MKLRRLGKTNLMVSEIGFGTEWMERHSAEEVKNVLLMCEKHGINILDCWMGNPVVRTNIGAALEGRREKWYIQGHVGCVWENNQNTRTRDMEKCRKAFEELLACMKTDYIDVGMVHNVDEASDYESIVNGPFLQYMHELKACGKIRNIGISTHNTEIARRAAQNGAFGMIMFSVNPAFDMLPPTDDIMQYFADEYDESLGGIDKERAELFKLCEQNDVGITVMKGYAGGRLLNAKASPFGVALTPVQCLHYCLTRPAVSTVVVGYDTPEHVEEAIRYEQADDAEKDYALVLAGAPRHAYYGQCTYCGHCRPCPMNIDIALVNKYYDLASMHDFVPDTLKAHYASLEVNASACVGCGACETRCPFGVKIAERMAKASSLFGS
ncbi:MAG: aldo/keto reductase [Clostridia bacterium]|nr:aldo/keto reductase [Clostridia bacterium]